MAHIMNGETYCSERYQVPFVWKWDEEEKQYKLLFTYAGEEYVIRAPRIDDRYPKYKQAYQYAAVWEVDDFLENKIAEEEFNAYVSFKTSKQ